jgi:hypothetical protein
LDERGGSHAWGVIPLHGVSGPFLLAGICSRPAARYVGFPVCWCSFGVQAYRCPGWPGVQPDDLSNGGTGWIGKPGLDLPGARIGLPLTWGISLMRETLTEGENFMSLWVSGQLIGLSLHSVVYLSVGLVVFAIGFWRARGKGTLLTIEDPFYE